MPLTPNQLATPTSGALENYDLQFPNLTDATDWQGQEFLSNSLDDDIFSGSLPTQMDPALIFGSRNTLEHPPRETRSAPTEPTSSLNTWVNDLARLNIDVCAFASAKATSMARAGSRVYGWHSVEEENDRLKQDMANFEPAFRMATELFALISRLHTGNEKTHRTGSNDAMDRCAWSRRASMTEQSRQERHVSDILNDSSNIFLLTSTYSRLFDLLGGTILSRQTQSTPPDVNLTLGAFDLANKPSMKTFVVVNMLEMLIRRIDHVLKLVHKDVDINTGRTVRARASSELAREHTRTHHRMSDDPHERPRGLGFVLEMVAEQQAAVLNVVRDSRRQLLAEGDL